MSFLFSFLFLSAWCMSTDASNKRPREEAETKEVHNRLKKERRHQNRPSDNRLHLASGQVVTNSGAFNIEALMNAYQSIEKK